MNIEVDGLIKISNFLLNNKNNIHKSRVLDYCKCMAHLRTPFMQTCTSSNPLFSYINGAAANFASLFNNE